MKNNRRQFVQTLGTSSAVIFSATVAADPRNAIAEGQDGQILLVGDNIAATQTEYGKVRGYVLRGIY